MGNKEKKMIYSVETYNVYVGTMKLHLWAVDETSYGELRSRSLSLPAVFLSLMSLLCDLDGDAVPSLCIIPTIK